jgi:predicted PurR-regulated permease PerM
LIRPTERYQSSRNLFLQKLIRVLPQLRDKKTAVAIARETESSISTYLATVTLVNLGLGLAVAGVIFLLEMPNPLLWGALAALAEFVPYLGATALVAVLGLAGLVTFEQVGHALLVPASYLTVNLLQSQLITPLVLGRRLTLNPVAIFIGLVFWWWIWGVPGAFVAVPLAQRYSPFAVRARKMLFKFLCSQPIFSSSAASRTRGSAARDRAGLA